jgi:RND family efflux transporter MFP subunit
MTLDPLRALRGSRRVWTAAVSAAPLLLLVAACTGGGSKSEALSSAPSIAADNDAAVRVQARPMTSEFVGYAQVSPIAALPVRTVQPGVVSGLDVVPGTVVREGQRLAALSGPEIRSLEVQSEGSVRSARARLTAASRLLAIDRREVGMRLVTRQMVAEAESALTSAQSTYESARAQLETVRRMSVLRAPSAGTVLAVNATDGERVAAGQSIVTLQASDRLWLKAIYYGADAAAIRPGMIGRFVPDTSSLTQSRPGVPVKVVTVFHTLQADSGEAIGLVATRPSPWIDGETGILTIAGAVRSLVEVPTRALILDRGRWWVLVRTARGDRAQTVVPGPARGWQTFIEQGLAPGQKVVVQNAFLEYYRGIAGRYQPPD